MRDEPRRNKVPRLDLPPSFCILNYLDSSKYRSYPTGAGLARLAEGKRSLFLSAGRIFTMVSNDLTLLRRYFERGRDDSPHLFIRVGKSARRKKKFSRRKIYDGSLVREPGDVSPRGGGGGGHFFLVLRRRNGASRGIGEGGRWKRQVECRYYVELEGAEPERGMKLLPRETAELSSLFLPPSPGVPLHDFSPFTFSRRRVGWG